MKVFLEHKNICLIVGVIMGILSVFSFNFLIPSSILLVIFGLYSFEVVEKSKKEFRVELNNKFEEYEKSLNIYKKDIEKLKGELETVKNRVNFNNMFGK